MVPPGMPELHMSVLHMIQFRIGESQQVITNLKCNMQHDKEDPAAEPSQGRLTSSTATLHMTKCKL